ncbi:MAG: DUF2628 domain-containing protein [Candidatus Rokubacteria bacterium]|nr:DUF2628 domain-containing protein [Candidatus Rokubacteria bacterium]
MSPEPGAADPRLYELRVSRIADGALRERLARWLVGRFPPRELQATVAALGGAGLVVRLPLRDQEAPALVRELYAAGVPPAALILLPAEVARPRAAGDSGADAAFRLFEARGGGFVPTWNWRAFVFGPLWYLRRGLYAKGAILLLLVVFPLMPLPAGFLVQLGVFFYCGLAGNWDAYLLEVRRTQWW